MSKSCHSPGHMSQQSSFEGRNVMGGYPSIHGFCVFTLLFQGKGLGGGGVGVREVHV